MLGSYAILVVDMEETNMDTRTETDKRNCRVFNKAYRESLAAGNCGWDAMVDAQRQLGAYLENCAEDDEVKS